MKQRNTYAYDDVGNRTQQVAGSAGSTTYTYSYNDLNELTAVTWTEGSPHGYEYLYDANGNVVTKRHYTQPGFDNVERWTYEWNQRNQLVSVTYDEYDSGWDTQWTVEYAYYPPARDVERPASRSVNLKS